MSCNEHFATISTNCCTFSQKKLHQRNVLSHKIFKSTNTHHIINKIPPNYWNMQLVLHNLLKRVIEINGTTVIDLKVLETENSNIFLSETFINIFSNVI